MDELAKLTPLAYSTNRLDGQLTYYRNAAQRLRRRQLVAIGSTACLAALATALVTEAFTALWVPVIVLVASTLTIVQQRARWQDRIALFSTALSDLQSIRDANALNATPGKELVGLVKAVESTLERESAGWLQSMGQASAEIDAFRHLQLDG